MFDERKVILSEDGSSTIYLPSLNETYHSTHGAITESSHVFIRNGLSFINPTNRNINILEVGMGTGLNVLLTFIESQKLNCEVHFHTLEPYPILPGLAMTLNYPLILKEEEIFKIIHNSSFDEEIPFSSQFSFRKFNQTLEEFIPSHKYELVFFDAFAPSKQPEIWSEDNFRKIFSSVCDGGVLVSYCASGHFKRCLKAVGFSVETLPGPPGKKEMTRATKGANV